MAIRSGFAAGLVRSTPVASVYDFAELVRRRELGIGCGVGVAFPVRASSSTQRWPFVAMTNGTFSRRGSAVLLGLLEAVAWVLVLVLRLDDRDRDRLGVDCDLDAERVVRPAVGLAPRSAVDDLDRPQRLLALDEVLGPAASVDRRVDQPETRLSLVHRRCAVHPARIIAKAYLWDDGSFGLSSLEATPW